MALLAPCVTARSLLSTTLLARVPTLKAALDSMRANIFVADLDLKLVYGNRMAMVTSRISSRSSSRSRRLDERRHERLDPPVPQGSAASSACWRPHKLPPRRRFVFGGVRLNTTSTRSPATTAQVVAMSSCGRTRRQTSQCVRCPRRRPALAFVGESLEKLTTQLTMQASDTSEGAQTAAAAVER